MSTQQRSLESMTCDELLKELARLSSERDQLNAQVGTPAQSSSEQASHVGDLFDQSHRINQIGDLLKEKGCQNNT